MTRKTDKTDLNERLAKPPMTWIDTQKVALRLLDKEVAALHEAGFEVADDFRRSTPEQLERVGVRAAAANRILEAAGVLGADQGRARRSRRARAVARVLALEATLRRRQNAEQSG